MTGRVLHYLLQEKQLFVVPGVGKFELDDVPAEIQHGAASIIAPGKRITFSPKQGKEYQHLSYLLPEVYGILPVHAAELERSFSAEISASLIGSRRYKLDGFGTLLSDTEGNLQFVSEIPVQQFSDTFGLRPISARQLLVKPVLSEEKDTPVIPLLPFDNGQKEGKGRSRFLSYAAAAAGMLMVAGSLVWLNSIGSFSNSNQAAVLPLASNQISAMASGNESKNTITEARASSYADKYSPVAPDSVKYYVVAGSFSSKYIAEDARIFWEKSGFTTGIHFSEEKNMTRISIGSFESKRKSNGIRRKI